MASIFQIALLASFVLGNEEEFVEGIAVMPILMKPIEYAPDPYVAWVRKPLEDIYAAKGNKEERTQDQSMENYRSVPFILPPRPTTVDSKSIYGTTTNYGHDSTQTLLGQMNRIQPEMPNMPEQKEQLYQQYRQLVMWLNQQQPKCHVCVNEKLTQQLDDYNPRRANISDQSVNTLSDAALEVGGKNKKIIQQLQGNMVELPKTESQAIDQLLNVLQESNERLERAINQNNREQKDTANEHYVKLTEALKKIDSSESKGLEKITENQNKILRLLDKVRKRMGSKTMQRIKNVLLILSIIVSLVSLCFGIWQVCAALMGVQSLAQVVASTVGNVITKQIETNGLDVSASFGGGARRRLLQQVLNVEHGRHLAECTRMQVAQEGYSWPSLLVATTLVCCVIIIAFGIGCWVIRRRFQNQKEDGNDVENPRVGASDQKADTEDLEDPRVEASNQSADTDDIEDPRVEASNKNADTKDMRNPRVGVSDQKADAEDLEDPRVEASNQSADTDDIEDPRVEASNQNADKQDTDDLEDKERI